MNYLNFTASAPTGRRAEIRSTQSLDYRADQTGYSLFTWHDDGNGVILWRERHEMAWPDAYGEALDWLNGGTA